MSYEYLITTSRRPTRRTRSFCKDLQRALPRAIKVNRGKMSLSDVALRALELGADRVVLVSVFKGNPGRIRFFSVSRESFVELPPTINIAGVKLVREFQRAKSMIPSHLYIFPQVGCSSEIMSFAEALASALKSQIISSDKLNTIPSSSAILRLIPRKNVFCSLLFTDKYGVPMGPLISVKSAWLSIRKPFSPWGEEVVGG